MSAPKLAALGWLVRDTFRQSLATGVFWLMLGVSGLCALACLTVTVRPGTEADGLGPPPPLADADRIETARCAADLVAGGAARAQGAWPVPQALSSERYQATRSALAGPRRWARAEVAFGALRLDVPGGEADAVRALQARLAGLGADAACLLLALLWTAGLLPAFLEPGAVAVIVAKPVSRPALLLGKCLGVFLFFALQALTFLAGTWLALGLRTGMWDTRYFLCLPLLLLHFAVFFSFSAMLAVATRSAAVCVLGTLLFWLLAWAMNFGRHALRTLTEREGLYQGLGRTVDLGYWLLPKPLDFQLVLGNALGAPAPFRPFIDLPLLAERGLWAPAGSLLASALCGLALLLVAVYDFGTAEY